MLIQSLDAAGTVQHPGTSGVPKRAESRDATIYPVQPPAVEAVETHLTEAAEVGAPAQPTASATTTKESLPLLIAKGATRSLFSSVKDAMAPLPENRAPKTSDFDAQPAHTVIVGHIEQPFQVDAAADINPVLATPPRVKLVRCIYYAIVESCNRSAACQSRFTREF